MNVNGRLPYEVRRYNLFKLIVLLLLGTLIGLTQLQTEAIEPAVQVAFPTPAPTVAPTQIVIAPPSLRLDSADRLIVNNSLTLRGTHTPEHVIILRQAGVEKGKAVVDEEGNWSYEIDLDAAGQAVWTAVATDGEGRISAESSPLILEVLPAPSAPTLDIPMLQDPFTGGDVVLTGSADAGSVVSILLNGRIYDVATADKIGRWSSTLSLAESGTHSVAAQLIDAAIDEVLTSMTIEINVVESE